MHMIRRLLVLLLPLLATSPFAQTQIFADEAIPPRYIARIELHTADELMGSLRRAEMLQQEGAFKAGEDAPIAFVLHGPEAESLFVSHYDENKALVNLAARLTAFKVVDIKVCEKWMGSRRLDSTQLPPFIGTVPFGPAEEKRLLKQERYVYF